MIAFQYFNPTKLYFGPAEARSVLEEIKGRATSLMIILGGDFLYKSVIYESLLNELKAEKIRYVVFDKVTPNPRLSDVEEAIKVGRAEAIDYVLAIGGGSAIDTAKTLAAGIKSPLPIWKYFENFSDSITDALPVGVILTLPATGSEVSHVAVITEDSTGRKRSLFSPYIIPRFALIDPSFAHSLPQKQLASGVVDMFSHIMEMFFSDNEPNILTDNLLLSAARTVLSIAERPFDELREYSLARELFLTANLANNGILSLGRGAGDWGCHNIEHELSSLYHIPHGTGLAIVIPAWMKHISTRDQEKFARFFEGSIDSLQLAANTDKEKIEAGIDFLEKLFDGMGLPTKLSQIGASHNEFDLLIERAFDERESLGMCYSMSKEDVRKILELAF